MNGITACLTGRLGSDAESRYLANGTALATFSVAVDDSKKAEGDQTEWIRCTIWGEMAETLAPRLTKGAQAYLEGRLKLEQWTTQAGEQRSTLKMSAWSCQVMGQIGRQRPRQPRDGRSETRVPSSRRREDPRQQRMPAMAAAVGNGRQMLDDDDGYPDAS